ncbi:MAG TPA: hypothetical protein VGR41_05230 [Actinomycetota bacterium]|jgi:hypothetical protein|nr:hypothetical protein [Actinomycetota bacterium]
MTTTGDAHRGTSSRNGWARRALLIAGSGLLLLVLGPVGFASADPCPLLDPMCVIEGVEETVDQTVDTAKDHANTTVDTVRKTAKDLTDPGDDDPGGGGGGGGGDDGGGNGHGPKPRDSSSRPTRSPVLGLPAVGSGSSLVIATVSETTSTERPRDEDSLAIARGLPAALREAAVGLALPLLLVIGIVVGFTTIQNRLDRRDPKLALAPLAVDVLRFE